MWMGLSKDGIGLHGTNNPSTIGRASSHGCIRLADPGALAQWVLRNDPAWIYWRARAQLARATTDAARAEATRALEGIAGIKGFYEMLALEDLGQKVNAPAKPLPLTPEEKDHARTNPGLMRDKEEIGEIAAEARGDVGP